MVSLTKKKSLIKNVPYIDKLNQTANKQTTLKEREKDTERERERERTRRRENKTNRERLDGHLRSRFTVSHLRSQ